MELARFREVYAPNVELRFDWTKVASGYRKAFYYDAFPVQNEQEAPSEYERRVASITALHDEIASTDGYRMYEGDARKRRRKGNALEQKKVDVMITVDMLIHTIRKNMDEAALIAGDLDFKPLLDALSNEGMFVRLYYPIGATSRELKEAADARVALSPRQICSWLTQDCYNHFHMPEVVNHSPPHGDWNAVGRTYQDAKLGEVTHYLPLPPSENYVTWPCPVNQGYRYVARFHDAQILRHYLINEFGAVPPVWFLAPAT